ncbi:hypothetical protein [Marinactinospora rubrisoli]|uniref:DUF1877 family protein n=1 Tax=Marinactinospora rubrisoli TaxID=2715399 RepID=A0ABW2KLK7_9ACTN
MGALYGYYRAADAQAAVRVADEPGGPTVANSSWDAVDGKGIDPAVVLGRLVALVRDTPWHTGLVDGTVVWPAGGYPADWERVPENSPWVTGPWIEELGPAARDTLAGIDNARIADLAARWARIEEFDRQAEPFALQSFLERLVLLARRARAAGEKLYCWSSL